MDNVNRRIKNVPLSVKVIGSTSALDPIEGIYSEKGEPRTRDTEGSGQSVVEIAGRTCYAAYNRKNQNTDSHEGYIYNMLDQNHLSVLEHASVSLYIEGISRAETHELVRHRHFSFSQESQRYVIAEEPFRVALHPTLLEHFGEQEMLRYLEYQFDMTQSLYRELRQAGLGRKQASEAARAFLPNAAETKIVVTGNLRSWIEFLSKRQHPAADRAMQRLAGEIARVLERDYPEVFSAEARSHWQANNNQGEVKHEAD